MSRYECRRCDYTPTGDEQRTQLADHAADAGHPLCAICRLSLERAERQTCVVCLGQVRRDLRRITDLYATLPAELGHAKAAPLDLAGGGHPDETPLPGGEVLPLLAGGSRGLTQISGAPTKAGWRDFSHEADERASDPQSVAFELSRWEDHWRHGRGEPAATDPPTVAGCESYLLRNMTWAADTDDEFPAFADDLTTIRHRLERVTARDERPETGAPCFDCGADLRRDWTPEGLSDDWTCPRCKQVYPDARYWLTVRDEYEREQAKRAAAKKQAGKDPAA